MDSTSSIWVSSSTDGWREHASSQRDTRGRRADVRRRLLNRCSALRILCRAGIRSRRARLPTDTEYRYHSRKIWRGARSVV